MCSESLVSQAGPGGAYEDTLLLVLSDHGQTQAGDHGGGTPAETDSVLIAMSLHKMHQAGLSVGNGSNTNLCGHCSSGALDRLVAAGGYTDRESPDGLSKQFLHPAPGPWFCNSSMSQIDLTPLLAHLLGVAVPFGNLGKIPPHLYVALAADGHSGSSRQQPSAEEGALDQHWLERYTEALSHNVHQVCSSIHAQVSYIVGTVWAWQVVWAGLPSTCCASCGCWCSSCHTQQLDSAHCVAPFLQVWQYLSRYAEVGGLPAADLAVVSKLYAGIAQLHSSYSHDTTATATTAAPSLEPASADNSTEELVLAQLSFLTAAADLARKRFTLFQQRPIWLGCALGVILLAWQVFHCW